MEYVEGAMGGDYSSARPLSLTQTLYRTEMSSRQVITEGHSALSTHLVRRLASTKTSQG